jgi:CRISPR-associated protein Cas1
MHPDHTTIEIENGLCVLSGYGIKVSIWRDQLNLEDGVCEQRRAVRFDRATCGLKRLAIIGAGGGYISLDALNWLFDIGAGLLIIGRNDALILATAPRGLDHPTLRRAQALAAFTDTGLEIMRYLLAEKVKRQRELCGDVRIDETLHTIQTCQTLEVMRNAESQAAAIFWESCESVPVRFARKDVKFIPQHWHTFGIRSSAITGAPHSASNPANAILNYAYAILDGETQIALATYGLDAGIGLLHAEDRNKAAMAYDVMEPVRPVVDRWFLDFLNKRIFTRDEFWRTRRGIVRLSLDLRREITRAAPLFAASVAPYVERVAEMLTESELPAILTWRRKSIKTTKKIIVPITPRCVVCGEVVEPGRVYCANCLPAHENEKLERFIQAGAMAERKHGGQSGKQRGETNRGHQRLNREVDVDAIKLQFEWSDILESIKDIPVRRLARETGLSLRYVSLIRRGLKIPHPRHWPLFAALGSSG